MTSQRKSDANRNNAKRSTGPRSTKGKRHASGNARRHGLAVPAKQISAYGARIEQLAQLFAGPEPGLMRLDLARTAAEAQLELCRARATKISILQQAGAVAAVLRARTDDGRAGFGERDEENDRSDQSVSLPWRPVSTDPEVFLGILTELIKLERYERRAFSRRKFAIRALAA